MSLSHEELLPSWPCQNLFCRCFWSGGRREKHLVEMALIGGTNLVLNDCHWVKGDDIDCIKRMPRLVMSMVFAGFLAK